MAPSTCAAAPNTFSVTWSRFEKIFQALNWTGSRLSFGYNYCSNVSRRCIQMIKGKAHSYNNLIERWGKGDHPERQERRADSLEKNLWLPGGFNQVNSCSNGGKIRMKDNYGVEADDIPWLPKNRLRLNFRVLLEGACEDHIAQERKGMGCASHQAYQGQWPVSIASRCLNGRAFSVRCIHQRG